MAWPTLLLCATSVALAVTAAELVLRSAAPAPRAYQVWPPHLSVRFHPAPGVMPGIEGPSRFTTNSLGMRGDEWREAGRYQILAIGGSTTESLYLDDSETWPRLLQEALNAHGGRRVWVGNVGRSGLNTRHHVMQVMRLLEQPPRVDAIIVLAGVNDLHNRLSRDADFLPIDQEPPSTFARLAREAFGVLPAVTGRTPWYRPFELEYRLSRLAVDAVPEELVQDDAGRIYERWRRHRREAGALRSRLPDLGPALREYAANLHTIVDVAARQRVRVVLATQPALWRPGLPPEQRALLWLGGVGAFQRKPGHDYYTVEALAAGMERYNRALLDVCQAREVECVDLAARLPADTSVFYDDCHLNESGSRRVAELFSQHLRRAGRRLASARP
jgi:lysophospholipase L1-like esterase